MNLGGLSDFRHVFSLATEVVWGFCSFKVMIRHDFTLGPASLRISATCVLIAVLTAADTWNLNITMSSATIHGSAEEVPRFTCVEAERTDCGAGLTRAMSCAAADVMSDVAD